MKDISLRQVIRNCLTEQRKLAKEKGMKLDVFLPETLPKIRGSSPRLQQVLVNLVGNSIQYTSEGTITVRVQEQKKDIKVEVEDTGIGIPADDMPHIFEDFFRIENKHCYWCMLHHGRCPFRTADLFSSLFDIGDSLAHEANHLWTFIFLDDDKAPGLAIFAGRGLNRRL